MNLRGTPPSTHRLAGLPGRLTPFIGRRADLESVEALLRDPAVRLVTISGAGGVGKTAFALELAGALQKDFEDGATFVPLSQLNSPDELLPALSHALDVQLPPSGDLQQALLDQLSGQQLMMLLDGFEHLVGEAAGIRVVHLRIPQVMGAASLQYVGFQAGAGQQWISWIGRDELASIIVFCLNTETLSGPVNAVSPNPLRNADFARTATQ